MVSSYPLSSAPRFSMFKRLLSIALCLLALLPRACADDNNERHERIEGAVLYDHDPATRLGDDVFGTLIADFSKPVEGRFRCSHGGPVCMEYADGTLVAFYANTSSHNLDGWSEYAISKDGGGTWDKYHPFPFSKEAHERDPARPVWVEEGLVTQNGTAVLFLTHFADGKRVANQIMRSFDHGKTWGAAEPLAEELIGYPAAVAVEDSANYVLFDRPDGDHELYASTDDGKTWTKRSTLPLQKDAWYGALCTMKEEGRLLAGAYVSNDEKHFYYCISEDGGHTWKEQRKAHVDKAIRDPELAYLDGKYYLHGRSGHSGPQAHRFVLYQSEDGMNWKEGVIVSGDERGPDGYSHNCIINKCNPDKPNELMVLYSIVYSPPRTCEYVFFLKPDAPFSSETTNGAEARKVHDNSEKEDFGLALGLNLGRAEVNVEATQTSLTGGIQEAIDTLPPEGGVVRLAPGTYILHAPVRVSARTRLAGPPDHSAVLRGGPVLRKEVTADLAAGSEHVEVADVQGLSPGVCVFMSNRAAGSRAQRNIIKSVDGNRVTVARPWSFSQPAAQCALWTLRPLVEVNEATDVVVENLYLDAADYGFAGNPPERAWDEVASADYAPVIVYGSRRVAVVQNWVANSAGSGIVCGHGSYDCILSDNRVWHMTFDGIHIGGGSEGVRIERNRIWDCHDQAGVYVCWWNRNATIRGNQIYFAKWGVANIDPFEAGMTICDNLIAWTQREAIEFEAPSAASSPGKGPYNPGPNLIRNNLIVNSSWSRPGEHCAIAMPDVRNTAVERNLVIGGGLGPRAGIASSGASDENRFIDNRILGLPREGAMRIQDPRSECARNEIEPQPHRFRFAGQIAEQRAYEPFPVTLEVIGTDGRLLDNFNGLAVLRDGIRRTAWQIRFAGGRCEYEMVLPESTECVLVCYDAFGAALSNPFVVASSEHAPRTPELEPLPAVHHFVFETIAPQNVAQPFEVVVRAVDKEGDTVRHFSGWMAYARLVGTRNTVGPTFLFFQDGLARAEVAIDRPCRAVRLIITRADDLCFLGQPRSELRQWRGESNEFRVDYPS